MRAGHGRQLGSSWPDARHRWPAPARQTRQRSWLCCLCRRSSGCLGGGDNWVLVASDRTIGARTERRLPVLLLNCIHSSRASRPEKVAPVLFSSFFSPSLAGSSCCCCFIYCLRRHRHRKHDDEDDDDVTQFKATKFNSIQNSRQEPAARVHAILSAVAPDGRDTNGELASRFVCIRANNRLTADPLRASRAACLTLISVLLFYFRSKGTVQ